MAPPTKLTPTGERAFRKWYGGHAKKLGLDPNPDAPEHHYDYRAAYSAGVGPTKESGWHWPSKYKRPTHPNRFVGGIDTITGLPQTQAKKGKIMARPVNNPEGLQDAKARAMGSTRKPFGRKNNRPKPSYAGVGRIPAAMPGPEARRIPAAMPGPGNLPVPGVPAGPPGTPPSGGIWGQTWQRDVFSPATPTETWWEMQQRRHGVEPPSTLEPYLPTDRPSFYDGPPPVLPPLDDDPFGPMPSLPPARPLGPMPVRPPLDDDPFSSNRINQGGPQLGMAGPAGMRGGLGMPGAAGPLAQQITPEQQAIVNRMQQGTAQPQRDFLGRMGGVGQPSGMGMMETPGAVYGGQPASNQMLGGIAAQTDPRTGRSNWSGMTPQAQEEGRGLGLDPFATQGPQMGQGGQAVPGAGQLLQEAAPATGLGFGRLGPAGQIPGPGQLEANRPLTARMGGLLGEQPDMGPQRTSVGEIPAMMLAGIHSRTRGLGETDQENWERWKAAKMAARDDAAEGIMPNYVGPWQGPTSSRDLGEKFTRGGVEFRGDEAKYDKARDERKDVLQMRRDRLQAKKMGMPYSKQAIETQRALSAAKERMRTGGGTEDDRAMLGLGPKMAPEQQMAQQGRIDEMRAGATRLMMGGVDEAGNRRPPANPAWVAQQYPELNLDLTAPGTWAPMANDAFTTAGGDLDAFMTATNNMPQDMQNFWGNRFYSAQWNARTASPPRHVPAVAASTTGRLGGAGVRN